MPIIHRAIKKLRHDKKRTQQNTKVKAALDKAVKTARKNPTKETITTAFSKLDKAAKMHIIHPNTAARLKSRLSKRILST